jgi:adenylyltransferase/sulfurtransferase
VNVDGATVGEALSALTTQYPNLRQHLFADDGKLRSFVNVYLNDEDVRYLKHVETPVSDADRLAIVPSVAGGRQRT